MNEDIPKIVLVTCAAILMLSMSAGLIILALGVTR